MLHEVGIRRWPLHGRSAPRLPSVGPLARAVRAMRAVRRGAAGAAGAGCAGGAGLRAASAAQMALAVRVVSAAQMALAVGWCRPGPAPSAVRGRHLLGLGANVALRRKQHDPSARAERQIEIDILGSPDLNEDLIIGCHAAAVVRRVVSPSGPSRPGHKPADRKAGLVRKDLDIHVALVGDGVAVGLSWDGVGTKRVRTARRRPNSTRATDNDPALRDQRPTAYLLTFCPLDMATTFRRAAG